MHNSMDTLTLNELYTLHRRAVWSVNYVLLLNKEMPGAWLGQWHWGQRGGTRSRRQTHRTGGPGRLEGAAGVPGNSGGSGLWGGEEEAAPPNKPVRAEEGARNSPT